MKLVGAVLVLALTLTACLPHAAYQPAPYQPSPYQPAPVYAGTGVYLNGQELTAHEKAQLDELIGEPVPPGRYFVDAEGNAGPEGGPAVVNLYALAQRRSDVSAETPTQIFSSGPTGPSSMTAVGDCIMVSTPDASFDTGC